ncbi:MAG: hypothetical protein ACJ72Z_04025 [Pyrinomonadaceae bacterium]
MNEEYLWSKKGSDREIEKFESLLSEFRFKEGPPPELPALNVVKVGSHFRRRFSWAALFVTAAAASVLAMIWVVTNSGDKGSSIAIGPDRIPSVSAPVSGEILEPRTEEPKPEIASVPFLRKPRFVKTVFRPRRNPRTPQTTFAQKQDLTREERYAYDRLMLALAITGTKLKVVQDTIDRKSDLDVRSNRNEK